MMEEKVTFLTYYALSFQESKSTVEMQKQISSSVWRKCCELIKHVKKQIGKVFVDNFSITILHGQLE